MRNQPISVAQSEPRTPAGTVTKTNSEAGKGGDVRSPREPGAFETDLAGIDLLNRPTLNKGTAFSEAERDQFNLHGLLPAHAGTLEEQMARCLKVLRALATGFERYAFLRELQDTNETLFFALLASNLEELLPLVYTPTVGEGCQRFSEIWRKPRGLFLSHPNKQRIREIVAYPRFDRVRVIVVSDGERILSMGDQGSGGPPADRRNPFLHRGRSQDTAPGSTVTVNPKPSLTPLIAPCSARYSEELPQAERSFRGYG